MMKAGQLLEPGKGKSDRYLERVSPFIRGKWPAIIDTSNDHPRQCLAMQGRVELL